MVGEGTKGAKVSAIERQDGVGLKLRGERHVYGVGKIEPQVPVADTEGLRRVEDVGRHLRKDDTTRPCPASDVINCLVRRIAAEHPCGSHDRTR